MASETLMTTVEVAALLKEHGIDMRRRTVQRRAQSGELPYLRRTLRGDYLFDRGVVEMFIRHHQPRPKAKAVTV